MAKTLDRLCARLKRTWNRPGVAKAAGEFSSRSNSQPLDPTCKEDLVQDVGHRNALLLAGHL